MARSNDVDDDHVDSDVLWKRLVATSDDVDDDVGNHVGGSVW